MGFHWDALVIFLKHCAVVTAALAAANIAVHLAIRFVKSDYVSAMIADAFLTAAEIGDVRSLKKFVKEVPIDVRDAEGRTALYLAAAAGHVEAIRVLLALGAPVEAANNKGATPLHAAAYSGVVKATQLLINAGADVNARTHVAGTPLMIAALMGHLQVVEVLLCAGADPMAVDKAGYTAFDLALSKGHTAVARRLARI